MAIVGETSITLLLAVGQLGGVITVKQVETNSESVDTATSAGTAAVIAA